jgi:hypothetical protein
MTDTPGQSLAATLRTMAHAYAAGDQVAPCAVLWTDPERLWEDVIPQMQALMPELYRMGPYDAAKRTGPAMWLRCIEARLVDGSPPAGTTPIFYLPGISRERLRGVEDCSFEVAALVELQFRGVMWMHPNGKEWTPYAYLISKHGGLGLDAARDQVTLDALARALPMLMGEPISHLRGRRLDADFFHGMLAPDANGLILRWLSDPDAFRKGRPDPEWQAFCQLCKADYKFDPVKDGPLKAARLLAAREHLWSNVWQRYAEAPVTYPGVAEWLQRAAPKEPSMFDSAEVWPDMNRIEESALAKELDSLADLPPHEAIKRITALESQHARRREYVWHKLGHSPMATVLEPLARLASLCASPPGAPSADAYAQHYADAGWQVDDAALATMAACDHLTQHGGVLAVLRTIYLPWLDATSRHLQKLIAAEGQSIPKRQSITEPTPGRLVLFADGLRMDVAQRLTSLLAESGITAVTHWDWSTIPSVTATAKPAASPIADLVQGGDTAAAFSTQMIATGQEWTQERFKAALKSRGWQFLGDGETGDPAGAAWTEAGSLDRRGHDEGWKLARLIESEVRDLAARIGALVKAGWKEVTVVTDHGWLLLPGGLPKVDLKAFLTDDRWGRCAALKAGTQPEPPIFPWHWNPSVTIACPPGAGCYRAGIEYSHGGLSLQEMVTPRLSITSSLPSPSGSRIAEHKWAGARCRITLSGSPDGLRVDLRTSLSDPGSSLLADRQPVAASPDGKATVFLDNDADIGREAELVLLNPSGQVLHSVHTTLGN